MPKRHLTWSYFNDLELVYFCPIIFQILFSGPWPPPNINLNLGLLRYLIPPNSSDFLFRAGLESVISFWVSDAPPQAATLFDQHRESQQQLACEILRTCDQWSATGRKETSRLVAAMQTGCWILHFFVCFNCFNPEELVQLGFHSHADGIWLSWTMLDPCLASLSEFSSKYRAVEWCGMVWMCRHRLLELVSDVDQLELG